MADNVLYYGDNLDILRGFVAPDSVDLIYLDPPFNSNSDYNVIFREADGTAPFAQIKAFTDTWHWNQGSEATYSELVTGPNHKVSETIQALRKMLGSNDVMAYLVMMTIRLIELHRVLKPTGSIYLHCDPTASHYLKIVMDTLFGKLNFRNEIIWHYRKWPTGRRQFQRNHDILLFYSKSVSDGRLFNELYMERAPSTLRRFGTKRIISAHDDEGKRLPSEMADEDSAGVRQDDMWDIGRVPPIKQLFPTEKPLPLLDRIIRASSREGDVVLDPFCGCGTAIIAAQGLNRRWIGIDITHLAVSLMKWRLKDAFGHVEYVVHGEPVDLESARALALEDRYQFQFWALSLVQARPDQKDQKKGADTGIDGRIYLIEGKAQARPVIISVKSGHVTANQVRDLRGVVERESAAIGLFITLEPATRPMTLEATKAGFYKFPLNGKDYPKIQTRTIEQLLMGPGFDLPPRPVQFKQAERYIETVENVGLFTQGATDQEAAPLLKVAEDPTPYRTD